METSGYYQFTEQKTSGNNREYHLFSETKFGLTMTMTSLESTVNSDVYGTLKIEDNVFNILDGSYFNAMIKMNLVGDISLDTLFESEIDGVYKIGFAANEDTYRFNMKFDDSILNETEEATTYTATYVLYNSDNSQVGFVKYTEDYETGLERFELYDLNEQIVEQTR